MEAKEDVKHSKFAQKVKEKLNLVRKSIKKGYNTKEGSGMFKQIKKSYKSALQKSKKSELKAYYKNLKMIHKEINKKTNTTSKQNFSNKEKQKSEKNAIKTISLQVNEDKIKNKSIKSPINIEGGKYQLLNTKESENPIYRAIRIEKETKSDEEEKLMEMESELRNISGEKRKWDDSKSKKYKQGKFSPEEIKAVKDALCEYVMRENLGTSGLISLITCTNIHEHNELYGAWCTIAESLPNRSVQSQQNLIRRKFNPNNYKGHWTKEEEKTLIDMISRVGKKWGIIAEELNRTPTNIKDKYKQIGGDNYKLRANSQILWTVGDIIKLIKAVQKVTQINILVKKSVIKKAMQEVYETDESNKTQSITENPNSNSVRYKRIRKRIEDENLQRVLSMIVLEDSREIIPYSNINWSLVVHKIKNRSIDDCRNKWYQQLFYLLTQKRRFTQLEDLNLIQQIHWTGAESIDEIDWNDIMNNKSISENKQRWIQLVKNLGINIGKNIQDIAQKLIEIIRNKQTNRSDIKKETKEEESIISYYNKYFAMSEQYI